MEALIPIVAIFFVIGVPVISIATHFVLRPLLRDLTEAVRGGRAGDVAELKERLARLESHLLEQDRELSRLTEAESFRRQLEERAGGPAVARSDDRRGAEVRETRSTAGG